MAMRRTIEIESSQFSPRAYWVPGAEYYEELGTIEYPDELDELSDGALSELATDEMRGCRWVDDDEVPA